MIELEVSSGRAKGQRLKTSAPHISIGRAQEHTLFIGDPYVSRHHGEIVLIEGRYRYRDLNSTHGTQLRRGAEDLYIKEVELREGDQLVLGGTDNIIDVVSIAGGMQGEEEANLTVAHLPVDKFGPPEEVFAGDSKALRALLRFDSMILASGLTNSQQLLRQLMSQISSIFDDLDYVAILQIDAEGVNAYDCEVLRQGAQVRESSSVLKRTSGSTMGIIYEIEGESLLKTQGVEAPISPNSAISRTDEDVMQGICVPIRLHEGVRWYLQLERPTQGRTVRFRQEDLALVRSMATRVEDRIDNLELIHANQRLHANAALGLFAGMIGHDIKNYLFFGKHLSEIRDDPLSMHPGIAKGIERARKLAQGMKDLAAPGHVRLKPFAVRDLVVSTAQEFKSLFGKQCHFECWGGEELEPVTTSEELLSRVVWNLVMNAYHASENRFSSLHAVPIIRVGAAAVEPDSFVVTVEDNVGGIGPRTLEYMQRSFDLIARVYTRQEDLVDVVNEISKMEGFTNSVGLFFTAVAVNDMSGSISVATEPGKGSIFTVQLPREIKTLRNLLRF